MLRYISEYAFHRDGISVLIVNKLGIGFGNNQCPVFSFQGSLKSNFSLFKNLFEKILPLLRVCIKFFVYIFSEQFLGAVIA